MKGPNFQLIALCFVKDQEGGHKCFQNEKYFSQQAYL